MVNARATVAVVDDDHGVREVLTDLLGSVGLATESYPDGELFLKACQLDRLGCIILDLRMPGISGLDVQKELTRKEVNTPIVMISGYGDVTTAVQAMQLGAVSFLQKPIREQELLDHVHGAMRRHSEIRKIEILKSTLSKRLESLTHREREVLHYLMSGATAKRVAALLGIGPKTVDYHRAQILEKMQVHTFTELMAQMLPFGTSPEFCSLLPSSHNQSAS
jgi:two-component system, LuxR family, response regulator FixJ